MEIRSRHLRESLYERLTHDKRSQLQLEKVARALEQLYGSEAVARSDDLAHHLFRAIDVVGADRAISAARESGRGTLQIAPATSGLLPSWPRP